MEFTFFSAFAMNIPLAFVSYVINLFLTGALLNRKPDMKKTVVLLVPYILCLMIPATWMYLQGMYGCFAGVLLEVYLEVTIWALSMKGIYGVRWSTAFAMAGLTVFLYGTFQELTGLFISDNYDLAVPSELTVYMVSECIGVLIPSFLAVWFIIRARLFEECACLLAEDSGKLRKIFIFLIPGARHLAVEITNEKIVLNNSNPMISILFFLLIYGVINYMFRCEVQRKQIEEQEMNLSQQELYIQNLESVQKEVRLFRHDFKNMMAGVSLQAGEGDLKAVREFISDVTGDFEHQVGEQIFQISQLGNVRITELKGLLLLKMTEMKKDEVGFRLEVPNPFMNAGIPPKDLCRAVGLLLDNAAEAAALLPDGEVTAIFDEGEEVTSIMIKNPVKEEVPLSRIWEDGYSSKGNDRGNGLTSFRRIIERFDYVASCTRQEGGYFIQEIKISKTGGKRHGSDLSV